MTAVASPPSEPPAVTRRHRLTLVIVVSALVIVALDGTILTVAIPTILEEFHTQLPSLQWVMTGYSLTFATFLIIGGRLGDIYGARRLFIIGASLFAVGSLIASISTSVPQLLLGEALIEGIGAAMMMPATLAILSTTFTGPSRARAFAVWGATAGAALAFGPLVGGFLTTNYSWRWAFRVNLIVIPLAVIGALLFIPRTPPAGRRQRIDVPGALLVASGMFLLVFALSEAGTYGWVTPVRDFTVVGQVIWPASMSLSVIPVVLVLSLLLLARFYVVERRKELLDLDPLFEFGQLRHLGFRYGLVTTCVLSMGQLGFLFVLPVFLQDGKHLSALENGLWLVPAGLFIVAGAQIGGRLTRYINTVYVVRVGLTLEAVGLVLIGVAITPDITLQSLLPGFALFGMGLGFASSQLTNVVLSDIPRERSGTASGANSTVRQLGAALGIAIIGSLLTTETIRGSTARVRASDLPTALKQHAVSHLHTAGVGFTAPPGTAPADRATLSRILESSIASGARPALFFGAVVVTCGAFLSLLIPRVHMTGDIDHSDGIETIDPVEALDVLPSH